MEFLCKNINYLSFFNDIFEKTSTCCLKKRTFFRAATVLLYGEKSIMKLEIWLLVMNTLTISLGFFQLSDK
jgi:hypothetical protein